MRKKLIENMKKKEKLRKQRLLKQIKCNSKCNSKCKRRPKIIPCNCSCSCLYRDEYVCNGDDDYNIMYDSEFSNQLLSEPYPYFVPHIDPLFNPNQYLGLYPDFVGVPDSSFFPPPFF